MAEDAASIIDEVLTDLGLDTSSPKFVTRVNVLTQINNCLIDLTENTYAFQAKDNSTVVWVTGTRSYDLPSDLYDILRVYDPVKDRVIYPIPIDNLNAYKTDWEEDEGEVTYYWRGGTDGMDKISFYKKPSSDYNGSSPTIQYRQYQTALTDSSSSYLPKPIHNSRIMVVDYCKYRLQRIHKEIRDIDESDKAFLRYLAKRKHWEAVDEASGRTYVYGARTKSVPGPIGPEWPSDYPDIRW